jgi:hypothetical protein
LPGEVGGAAGGWLAAERGVSALIAVVAARTDIINAHADLRATLDLLVRAASRDPEKPDQRGASK